MTFPNSVPLPSTSSKRPSYHSRLLCDFVPTPSQVSAVYPSSAALQSSQSGLPVRHSMVKVSSPLRCEIGDEKEKARPTFNRKSVSYVGLGGLLSPPPSPEDGPKPPPPQRPTGAERRKSSQDLSTWSSSSSARSFPTVVPGFPTPPSSPPASPKSLPRRASVGVGMWADTKPAKPSSLSKPVKQPEFELAGNAPKFSRSGLKKSGVVMPVSAPRPTKQNSSSSLRTKGSVSSLRNGSTTSLTSLSSATSSTAPKSSRQPTRYKSQDRLLSLAETSRKELQLNEEGLLALDSLSPPRPGFLRSASNSSMSSLSSVGSAGSTAATTASYDRCDSPECITEEPGEYFTGESVANENDPSISCTKSDGDADGSIESSSMKSGGGKVKKGGLFKRLGKALKLEKKTMPGQEFGRRVSN